MDIKRQFESFDFILVILVFGLCIFGIIAIGSATKINLYSYSPEFKAQIIWFATGVVLMFLAAFVDYNFICKFYIPIYVVNIILLIAVFIMDTQIRGVSRWFKIGELRIQPSEFAKLFMIIFLAKFIDKKKDLINNISILSLMFLAIAIPALLIFIQPSLTAGATVVVVSTFIIFIGKIHYKYVLVAIFVIVPVIVFLCVDASNENPIFINKILDNYQIERIKLFIDPSSDPDKYRQTEISIHAVGSGMLTGKGLYGGFLNKDIALFAAENDFIFAVIGQEFGFAGSVTVLTVMFLIISKCLLIAGKASDICGRLIAAGVACMFFFQTFVNVGVATGMLPNTGMPFPFVSYGGSSMWVSMSAIGFVLNVGMSKPKSIFEG